MGFLDNKFIARFINGGAPPASYTQQIRDRPPPNYEAYATQRGIENNGLQKTQIYLNLPTQREREQEEQEERERREKDPASTVKRHTGAPDWNFVAGNGILVKLVAQREPSETK
ncbi:hypothetical protein E8E12_003023 [Didymella heteroderae]|uniref:Uncharacterized protein n=1 Tax=Didymella heteroderae TaxID=1769908 RepID=A0A9P4WQ43_9PLEO|nr:hypothetical protein E8E12_003023 [Didymella heteroderae]